MEIAFKDQALTHIGATRRLYYRGGRPVGMATIFGPSQAREDNEEALSEHRGLGLPLDAKLREIEALLAGRPKAIATTVFSPLGGSSTRVLQPDAQTPTQPAPAEQPVAGRSFESLVAQTWAPGSQWATRPAESDGEPSGPVSRGVAGAEEDPVPPLSAEAAQFVRALDPGKVYERWNRWQNPQPKRAAKPAE